MRGVGPGVRGGEVEADGHGARHDVAPADHLRDADVDGRRWQRRDLHAGRRRVVVTVRVGDAGGAGDRGAVPLEPGGGRGREELEPDGYAGGQRADGPDAGHRVVGTHFGIRADEREAVRESFVHDNVGREIGAGLVAEITNAT